jgi:hypothetical protein
MKATSTANDRELMKTHFDADASVFVPHTAELDSFALIGFGG